MPRARPRVLIIDNRLARRFWPNGDALGKRMYFPQDISNLMAKPKEEQMMTIVGIIEPMRLRGLVDAQAQKTGAYYSPLRQVPSRTLGVAIRTAQAPETRDQRRAPRDRADRSGDAVLRRADDGRSAVDVADGSPHADAARHRLRRRGAVPRGDRHLRRAGVSGVAAPARDRHSHGARRRIGQHLQSRVERRRH